MHLKNRPDLNVGWLGGVCGLMGIPDHLRNSWHFLGRIWFQDSVYGPDCCKNWNSALAGTSSKGEVTGLVTSKPRLIQEGLRHWSWVVLSFLPWLPSSVLTTFLPVAGESLLAPPKSRPPFGPSHCGWGLGRKVLIGQGYSHRRWISWNECGKQQGLGGR